MSCEVEIRYDKCISENVKIFQSIISMLGEEIKQSENVQLTAKKAENEDEKIKKEMAKNKTVINSNVPIIFP